MAEKRVEFPIDSINHKDFNDSFKVKYLDGRVLSDEALKEIGDLFLVGDRRVARTVCDEMHAHSYRCIEYYSPTSGVVERLIDEIKRYKKVLSDISDSSRESLS